MDELNKTIKRLENQYEAYARERFSEDEEADIDVSVACSLADSVPYLLEQAKKLLWIEQAIYICNKESITPKELAEILRK